MPSDVSLIVRQLTSSDLGLFYAQRSRIDSKQRAININSAIVSKMLSTAVLDQGETVVLCRRWENPIALPESRLLKKSGKNWRLGGEAIRDKEFGSLRPGDLFLGKWSIVGEKPSLSWKTICHDLQPELYRQMEKELRGLLDDRMALLPSSHEKYQKISDLLTVNGKPAAHLSEPIRPYAAPPEPLRNKEAGGKRR